VTPSRTGVVAEFDAGVGLGVISAADGTKLEFHCTQIVDGSRTIPTGVAVRFSLRAGRGGRWEAGDIRPTVEER
jgi:cold shock CspA family protein